MSQQSSARGLVALVPLLFVTALVALLGIVYVHQGVLRPALSDATKREVSSLVPQGWAFFTKSPRVSYAVPYAYDSDGIYAQIEPRQRRLVNLNRADRNFVIELELLDRALSEHELMHCPEGKAKECFDLYVGGSVTTVKNPRVNPQICGDVFVALTEIVPWSWRNLTTEMARTTNVALLEVTC